MKVTITIEKFDNGISIVQKYLDGGGVISRVALDSQKETELGRRIWEDVKDFLEGNLSEKPCNSVDINIEYKPKV